MGILDGLTTRQTLELANFHLEYARKTSDNKLALAMCNYAESALVTARRNARWARKYSNDQALREGIAQSYFELAKLQAHLDRADKARGSLREAERWRFAPSTPGVPNFAVQPSHPTNLHRLDHTIVIPQHIFEENVRPPVIEFKPPEVGERLSDTHQLTCCLSLLQTTRSPDEVLEPAIDNWLRATKSDSDERERLKNLATGVIREFKIDALKDVRDVAEVVHLAPVLDKDDFRNLLMELYLGVEKSGLLDIQQLEGLARLIQGADPDYVFEADDLVKILELLNARLRTTHQQSPHHMYQLTLAVSRVLDAMADANVKDLDRVSLHEPLTSYLSELKERSEPYLVYQAAYAYQALLYVPDNETLWQSTLRRTGKVIQGVSRLVSAVKGFDLVWRAFIKDLQEYLKPCGMPKRHMIAQSN